MTNMTKIAFVSTQGGAWGGSEKLWAATAASLRRRGIPVAVNIAKWSNEPAVLCDLEKHGVAITRRQSRGRMRRKWDRLTGNDMYAWLDGLASGGGLAVINQSCLEGTAWALECQARGI